LAPPCFYGPFGLDDDNVTETPSANQQPPTGIAPGAPQIAQEVELQFRERDPGAFFVLPRVVRRVWQNELNITSNWLPPPHRKSCVVERDQLLWLVARDELGVEPDAALPQRIILIARPEEDRMAKFSREDLLRYYWRLLFHARIDFEMELKTSPGRMTPAELRRRIDALGQTQFDEIRSVLRSELMLRRPDDARQVYAEFVAVYHELHAFAPALLPLYFPSLDNHDSVLRAIGPDCDFASLLEATRPHELQSALPTIAIAPAAPVEEALLEGSQINLAHRSPRKYAALVRRADRLRLSGNNVRAALVRRRAFDLAPLDQMSPARRELIQEIEFLVLRLQAALELTDDDVRPWLTMCERLLPGARRGFWNANARLLYDLQQVCLDHEQEIYRVDLLGWCRTLGRQPIKRPLPNQRVVLMSKHLRSAALRVPMVVIDEDGRDELSELLHAAADAAEHILRKRFDPMVAGGLSSVGFQPTGVVERVAFRKMTHELLDGIVKRGFLTLGDLRDSISRNQLKMPDMDSAHEFFSGDSLLRGDRQFASSLDGVYQRGPFYLRWLQRLNSLTFGIPSGRAITKYFALPFGLAFLILMAVEEVAHLLFAPLLKSSGEATVIAHDVANEAVRAGHAARHHLVYSPWNTFWLGCFIFALIHAPQFREAVVWLLKKAWKVLRVALIDLPHRIARFPLVVWLVKWFPMMLFRRFVVAPLLVTAFFWLLLPAFGAYARPNRWWGLAIFLASTLVLNSRLGRDTEELTREFVSRTWYRIRVHLLLGLFTLVVDAFHWLMDGLERVLYAVDEWLRFRSGESRLTLGIKALLGVVWAVVHGVIRFCVTLLIEPQVNPIKHFPVVTVSHKLLLPLAYTSHPATIPSTLASILLRVTPLSTESANWVMATLVWGIPGIFGFLAWELQENWKLYTANRLPTLRPVLIGHHGETLLRLLCPGLHSGTIPKLFARRRRAARKAAHEPWQINRQARFTEKLLHEAESVRHFVERELIGLLRESRTFGERSLSVGRVDLATNRVLATICDARNPDEPVCIEFAEQSGWLIASVADQGWLRDVIDEERAIFRTALAGLYKLGAVDLVREQIESQLVAPALPPPERFVGADNLSLAPAKVSHPYDIDFNGLIVWPHHHYEAEVHYALEEGPTVTPRPRSLARAAGLMPLPWSSLVYREHRLEWDDWQAYWDAEQNPAALPIRLLSDVELLKPTTT
jgi:hypothetical protein